MPAYALLVDPDASRLQTYEHLLAAHGVSSFGARDGRSAMVELERRGPPALVVTELALRDQDGFGFVAALKDKVRCPVLAITRFRALAGMALRKQEALGLAGVLPSDLPLPKLDLALQAAMAGTTMEAPPPDHDTPLHLDPTRLAALAELGLVDDLPPDELLQQLCGRVAHSLGVETALVTFILGEKAWFKAYSGLAGELLTHRGAPLDKSFCKHVVDAKAPLLVPDARNHPFFSTNAYVQSGQVRGYAGVPLQTSKGVVLGTLCVVDSRPISMGTQELALLRLVARQIAGELELQVAAKKRPPTRPAIERRAVNRTATPEVFAAIAEEAGVGVRVTDLKRQVLFVNDALSDLVGLPVDRLRGQSNEQWLAHLRSLFFDTTQVEEKLAVEPEGPYAAKEELEFEKPTPRVLSWVARPLTLDMGVVQLELFESRAA